MRCSIPQFIVHVVCDLIPCSSPAGAAAAAAGICHCRSLMWGLFLCFFVFVLNSLASLRSNLATAALFFFLDITFMFLMIGQFNFHENMFKAGGGAYFPLVFSSLFALRSRSRWNFPLTRPSIVLSVSLAFGILTAAIAYYVAASGVITPQASYFGLPVIDLPKRHL